MAFSSSTSFKSRSLFPNFSLFLHLSLSFYPLIHFSLSFRYITLLFISDSLIKALQCLVDSNSGFYFPTQLLRADDDDDDDDNDVDDADDMKSPRLEKKLEIKKSQKGRIFSPRIQFEIVASESEARFYF